MPQKKPTQQTKQTQDHENEQEMTPTFTSLHDRVTNAVNQLFNDHESGFSPLSFEQLLRLKAAIDADRPSAFIIMTVLANALNFLNHQYSGEPANLFIISDFLAQFQQSVAADLLSKEPSIRDGLALLKQG